MSTGNVQLQNQPSAAPTNKVAAAGVAGTVVTLALAVLDSLSSSSFDGAWWGSAAATVSAFVAAYLRRERAS